MAELQEELACMERQAEENAQKAKEERVVKAAEEARLAEEVRLEEERRAAEEERKQREAEEEGQVAVALAEYQRKEVEKAEAEKIEAERAKFKKQGDAVLALHKVKVKAKVQREMKAKAKKEAVARSESEKAEGSKKHGQEDNRVEISVTVGSFLMEHGVEWMVKEGVVCDSCEKREKKCFWRMEAELVSDTHQSPV